MQCTVTNSGEPEDRIKDYAQGAVNGKVIPVACILQLTGNAKYETAAGEQGRHCLLKIMPNIVGHDTLYPCQQTKTNKFISFR